MNYINISHRRTFEGKINGFSSQLSDQNSIHNIVKSYGYWSSERRDIVVHDYFIIEYPDVICIDFIEMLSSPQGPSTFPKTFRFEASYDGKIWKILHSENGFTLEEHSYLLEIPLTLLKFLKVVIIEPRKIESKYISQIGQCITGIMGIKEITASSTASSDKGAGNLLDTNSNVYWESQLKSTVSGEWVFVDLGKIFPINRVVLSSGGRGFPENFHLEVSSDKDIWIPLFEEKNFKAEYFKIYYWEFNVLLARYLRLEAKTVKYVNGPFGLQIADLVVSAAPVNYLHTHNAGGEATYASIFQQGVVRLAKDGESSAGTAVQGNDSRLRDATTIFKGIVQLADDWENKEGFVVQASDSRIKQASEEKPGIVRLSKDCEISNETAVQGSDSRLKDATLERSGIVKLCPDGMYSEYSVITGNDSRLHKATVNTHGICKLAEDGSAEQGAVIQANDKRLRDSSTSFRGIVELADDGEVAEGLAVQAHDRRLKDATIQMKGIVELAEDGEDNPNIVVQGNDRRLKDATTKSRGIVELAEDGEDNPNVVVQGNDRRLKDATESNKGIMRFAKDNERLSSVAVQGNDSRLKDATTLAKGIVELAEDGEEKPGVAVQGNDSRLKDATTHAKGIVELAEDGEDKARVAVQGNDRRIKDASETAKGIMRFAKDGDHSSFAAVQGSDRRLKDATIFAKGIVELAEDGEDKAGVVVQGNDKRLRDSSTVNKGIVELAEDGEDAQCKVVQGNDRRLKPATEAAFGIVRFVKNNESRPGYAVQGNDERLHNDRTPLPHNHDYAPLKHDLNSHPGALSIRQKRSEVFNDITPPIDTASVIFGHNISEESSSIGVAGVAGITTEKNINSYGVVGHSRHIGVRGQSSGKNEIIGCGVMGISRFGAGGVFASEYSFSLVADGFGDVTGYDESINLKGNGEALLVKGRAEFNGQIGITNPKTIEGENFPANIVEFFEVDDVEYITPGDILVVSEKGNSVLSRSRSAYSRSIIGVVSGNPTVSFSNCGVEKKICPVILAGKALCRIDARSNPVLPGDLIVASDTSGCGMKGTIDSFGKIGTCIGKALHPLENGIGLIPIFIFHQ